MREEIFRKKSLEKLKSPESLDQSIRVTNPGIWLILAAVILLLIGAVVWGAFGHIDSTVPISVHAEKGVLTGTVTEENITSVKTEMTVHFAEYDAEIENIRKEDGGYICALSAESSVPDGYYDGNIVIQSFKPFSFIFN
ncbi:MAG: hypothetical protein KBS52_05700 [Clostridiales bacterium]|nr:hypothetical protein [Candidatus Equinaster intestinalis]